MCNENNSLLAFHACAYRKKTPNMQVPNNSDMSLIMCVCQNESKCARIQ